MYLPAGIAIRSGIQGSDSKLPHLIQQSAHNVIRKINSIYARVVGLQALVAKKYCYGDLLENMTTYDRNGEDCIYPTPASQRKEQTCSEGLSWGIHQVALRIMDNTLDEKTRALHRLALHTDDTDVCSKQFLTFKSMGGVDGKGGRVVDSDLLVFEHDKGGQSYRLKTSIADTVVFVLMNSSKQLHGSAKDRDTSGLDESCWCLRFIGYGRRSVLQFVGRRKKGIVSGQAFWGTKVKLHTPLSEDKYQINDEISAMFGKQLLAATLIEHNGGMHCLWQKDSKLTVIKKGRIFSKHCSKYEPHLCPNCNPNLQFDTMYQLTK